MNNGATSETCANPLRPVYRLLGGPRGVVRETGLGLTSPLVHPDSGGTGTDDREASVESA